MKSECLSARQRNLAIISCLEAQGDLARLEPAIIKALDEGLYINEIKEAFSQLYAYTGFPRSLNALGVLQKVLNSAQMACENGCQQGASGQRWQEGPQWTRPAEWDDAGKALELGTMNQTELGGGRPFNYSFCPQDDYYLKAHLFGDIFAGETLSKSDRELVTVAALSGMKGVGPQLAAHKAGAVNMGNTPEQVDELCRFLSEQGLSQCDYAADANAGSWPKGEPNVNYARFFTGNSHLAPITPANFKSVDKGLEESRSKESNKGPEESRSKESNKGPEDGRSMESKTVLPFSNVTFEPGCRNNWHIHHGARQILVCVGGEGLYQEWGKPAVHLKAGDIVDIPEGVKHWHGAAMGSWFQHLATHVAVENTCPGSAPNEWLEPVDDEQYAKANRTL